MGHSIVDIQQMGDALRNTGYKNIESAVAEIVDNSIEAEAKNVFIILSEGINKKSGRKVVTEVGFLDDGYGMDTNTLGKCLGIGSTTRIERKGLGRFGVGLPQSSLYATPEIEVYSWQNGIKNCQKVYLNIEKVKDGEQTEIADPEQVELPSKYRHYIKYVTPSGNYDFTASGTLVLWKNCDRIVPKTRGPLVERLEFSLGQKFRYFIHRGISRLKIICDENQDVQTDIFPNDPLFLMEDNFVLGDANSPSIANKKMKGEGLEPFFEPFVGDEDSDDNGEVKKEIRYYDKNGDVKTGEVIIRFSIVKHKFYDSTAFPAGKNPGNGEFGKRYAAKMEGISVIRANREIDFRKFDFYDNVNEPQHRWWGCEIEFDPLLDEAFGVANNKQYVELKRIEEEDIDFDEEVQPVWLQLYDIVNETIKEMYKRNEEVRKSTRSFDDVSSPATEIINIVEDEEYDTEEETEEETTQEERILAGREELESQGYEDPTDEQAERFILNHINFVYSDQGERGNVFDYKFKLDTTIITINTSHQFYKSFLQTIYSNKEVQTTFELFLASIIQSVRRTNAYQQSQNDKLMTLINRRISDYIEEQINPRVSS